MNANQTAPRENVLLGTLGSLLFALVGGVVYYVLWSINIIAALSGIICVLCAIKGYEIFSRRSTRRGIIISVAISAAVLIFAWYFCFCADMHDYYRELHALGQVAVVPSMATCLLEGYRDLPVNPGYLVNLLLSLSMAALGCWGYVIRALHIQAQQAERQAEQNRTMELARAQAEQAEKAARAEAARAEAAQAETVGNAPREAADTASPDETETSASPEDSGQGDE